MPDTQVTNYIFGAVNSRSNPLNIPLGDALYCRNWVVVSGGWLELRDGYTAQTQSAVVATAIHSMADYRLWDNTRYLLFIQGTALKRIALSDGTVTSIGTLSSSSRASFFRSFNRIHFGNGSEMRSYDGTTLRTMGVRAPTATEADAVAIANGVRVPATVTAASNAAGGSMPATTKLGHLVYAHYFDTTLNELGPALAASARVKHAAGATNQIDITNLEDLSASTDSADTANWVKVFSISADGGANSYFCTNTSTAITSCSRISTTLTVISTTHGLSTGDVVILSGTTNFDGLYKITKVDNDTFTVTLALASGANTTGGTCKRLIKVARATTTGTITTTTTASSMVANAARGLDASSVGGAQPGYQFYMAIYNVNDQQVGNRIAIGSRYAPTVNRNVKLTGLPDLSGENTEWVILLGRTGDGAEVPYAVADSSINWIYASSGVTSKTITDNGVDYDSELPTRNGIPPNFDKLVRIADRIYGVQPNSPYVYRSESDLPARAGTFVGRPECSWAPNNFETFPTGAAITCIGEYEQQAWVFTKYDGALLVDTGGLLQWIGPFNVGCAGQRAFCNTAYGPFWLTSEKQLATMGQQGPVLISEEYEATLLSQFGDAYLSNVELVYFRDAITHKDHIKIKGRDSSGNPIVVIHDFRLRTGDASYGRAYDNVYVSALASDFTMCQSRDSNDKLRVYAGATSGQIYILDSGTTDNGTEFTSTFIGLANFGPERVGLRTLEWQGDGNARLAILHDLTSTSNDFEDLDYTIYPSAPNDSLYQGHQRVVEMLHGYIRVQLTSHSSDGSLALNTLPHMPVETYGRVYMLRAIFDEARQH